MHGSALRGTDQVPDDDIELLRRWRGGDARAGEALFERYFERIYVFFCGRMDDGVEDMVQRTFLGCVEAGDRLDEIESFAEHVERVYGHPSVPLDRAGIAALLGTERYHGGFLDRAGGHLHPLKFALGLARAASAAGAAIHERTRVVTVAPGVVTTEGGSVRAERVLVACNGYIDGLAPPASACMRCQKGMASCGS